MIFFEFCYLSYKGLRSWSFFVGYVTPMFGFSKFCYKIKVTSPHAKSTHVTWVVFVSFHNILNWIINLVGFWWFDLVGLQGGILALLVAHLFGIFTWDSVCNLCHYKMKFHQCLSWSGTNSFPFESFMFLISISVCDWLPLHIWFYVATRID